MNQLTLLNILVIAEALLLLVLSLIVFHLKNNLLEKNIVKSDSKVLKEDFLPIIVHEMRSPLSIINGAADLWLKIQTHCQLNKYIPSKPSKGVFNNVVRYGWEYFGYIKNGKW